jgi:hypothetical protein
MIQPFFYVPRVGSVEGFEDAVLEQWTVHRPVLLGYAPKLPAHELDGDPPFSKRTSSRRMIDRCFLPALSKGHDFGTMKLRILYAVVNLHERMVSKKRRHFGAPADQEAVLRFTILSRSNSIGFEPISMVVSKSSLWRADKSYFERPRAVVALGRSAQALAVQAGVELEWFRQFSCKEYLVFPCPHPSGLNRIYNSQESRDALGRSMIDALDYARESCLLHPLDPIYPVQKPERNTHRASWEPTALSPFTQQELEAGRLLPPRSRRA